MKKNNQAVVRIDIVSDVVCPWCIVGYKQLEQALIAGDVSADIRWQPFELNPEMPTEGQNLSEHIKHKYGMSESDNQKNRQKLIEIGTALDFPFNYTDESRMLNTFSAHQLLHWAAIADQQHQLKITLFHCYFIRGLDISDHHVLANAAAEIGLDYQESITLLRDGVYAEAVREQQRFALSRGIQGVPAMIFNREYLVTGAQGTEYYDKILAQLLTGTQLS